MIAHKYASFAVENKNEIMRIFNIGVKTKKDFIKGVCAKMAKSGHKCVLKTENLFVINTERGSVFAQMWETPDKGRRRIHFIQEIMIQGMENLSNEGAAILVSECNNNMDYTTMQFEDGHFACVVVTFVGSDSDFVREFNFAFKQIGDTLKVLAANYPAIMKQYNVRSERRPIGFLAERYMAEKEKTGICKLVAQTYSTFAAENNNQAKTICRI